MPLIRVVLVAVIAAWATGGCKKTPAKQQVFPITFVATSDGEPLGGVQLQIGNKPLGGTKADGLLHVQLTGREGQAYSVLVECPDGYRGPEQRPVVTLTRFQGLDQQSTARGLEVSIACAPLARKAVLVVRAGEPNLPILAKGREVARTDGAGVAHAMVTLEPHSTFRMAIDTSALPELRPRNPSMTLTVEDSDEIFIVDQAFTEEAPVVSKKTRKKKRRKRPAKKKAEDPKPALPVRIK